MKVGVQKMDASAQRKRRDDHTTSNPSSEEKELQLLMYMEEAVPGSAEAERKRFLTHCNGNHVLAADKLKAYMKWRCEHCDEGLSKEMDPWTYATKMAQKFSDNNGDKNATTVALPCIVYVHERTQTKTRYVQHLPARIDTTLATQKSYALALAVYLEHLFDRNSLEKITLVIDVRAGKGFANILAVHLIPFMQMSCRLLSDLHPERLESCILFPMPKIANVIWKAVKPFLHKDTKKKIVLVNGSAGISDPVPKKMSQLIDKGMIKQMEDKRRSCFS